MIVSTRKLGTSHGFTLVELIVLVVILGIISAVAIVGYTQFIQEARDEVAVTVVTQVEHETLATIAASGNAAATPLSLDPAYPAPCPNPGAVRGPVVSGVTNTYIDTALCRNNVTGITFTPIFGSPARTDVTLDNVHICWSPTTLPGAGSGTITVGSCAAGTQVITGFTIPQVLVASPDGTMLYTAQNNGSVVKVNTPANTIASSWNSGITNPLGITISPDGTKLYMANRLTNVISVRNASTGAQTASWSTGSGTAPTGIALSPDGTKIYVPQNAAAGIGSSKLTVRNASNGALQQTWSLGSRPRAVVISPDGLTAYVTMETQNRISVRSTTTGTETASWSLASTGLTFVGYVALSKNGSLLYATGGPGGVVVLNTATGIVTEHWTDGIVYAFGVTRSSCSDRVFITDSTANTVIAVSQPSQC